MRFHAPAARWRQRPWSIRRPFLECACVQSLRLFPPVGSQSRWGRTPRTRRLRVCPGNHLSRIQRAHHRFRTWRLISSQADSTCATSTEAISLPSICRPPESRKWGPSSTAGSGGQYRTSSHVPQQQLTVSQLVRKAYEWRCSMRKRATQANDRDSVQTPRISFYQCIYKVLGCTRIRTQVCACTKRILLSCRYRALECWTCSELVSTRTRWRFGFPK